MAQNHWAALERTLPIEWVASELWWLAGRVLPNVECIDECFVCARVKSVQGTEPERLIRAGRPAPSNPLDTYPYPAPELVTGKMGTN